jgi:hypothetical protein
VADFSRTRFNRRAGVCAFIRSRDVPISIKSSGICRG